MSKPVADRILSFLQRTQRPLCESCLVQRVLIASREAVRAAIASEPFTLRMAVCADCRTRKQVVAVRDTEAKAA